MRLAALAALAVLSNGCAGPCKQVARERAALAARTGGVAGPSARIRVPLALANGMIAQVVAEQPPVPLDGGLARVLELPSELRAVLREVTLVPAGPGKIGVDLAVAVVDADGTLLGLRGATQVAAVVDPGDPANAEDRPPSVAIAIRWDQLERLEPELGARATERLGAELEKRLPESVRQKMPRFVADRLAKKVVESASVYAYKALKAALLGRLGELTRIRIPLPPMPVSRVDVAPVAGDVPALDLEVYTTLPIRAAVGAAQPATADAIGVEIAGSAAAELANWSIAHGVAPQHYTRELEPRADGAYVPYFDWRPTDGARPLVVHMFRTRGSCAHFTVGLQPHVEVQGDQVRGYIANKRLERADATVGFSTIVQLKSLFDRSYSDPKKHAAQAKITVGDREVTTHLVRATIGDGDLRLGVAVELGPRVSVFVRPTRRSRTLPDTTCGSRGA